MAAYQSTVVLHALNFVAHHQRAQEVIPASTYVSSPRLLPVTAPISPVVALQQRAQICSIGDIAPRLSYRLFQNEMKDCLYGEAGCPEGVRFL